VNINSRDSIRAGMKSETETSKLMLLLPTETKQRLAQVAGESGRTVSSVVRGILADALGEADE
jgi:predicted DNA-binding protein